MNTRRILHNTPVKRKLTILSMFTSAVALLFACGAFVSYEQVVSRANLVNESLATAQMVGDGNIAALTFGDVEAAEKSLSVLNRQPAIIEAAIYDKTGHVYAKYQSAEIAGEFTPPRAESDTHWFGERGLALFNDIQLNGEKIGTIFLLHDYRETRGLQRQYALISVLVMAVSLFISWAITTRLYRTISVPVSQMASIVSRVATEKDYSIRAVKLGEDELGQLIDGFNEMLDQIQNRDSALESARRELEGRVVERTQELATSLSMLNATLDSTADGIIAVDLAGKMVCYNTKFAVMWDIPQDMLKRQDGNEMAPFIAAQTRDPDRFMQKIGELYKNRGAEAFDVIELKDGRTLERYIQPQRVGSENVGMVANFRDITERKRAEAELEKAYRQLLETSRQAGMAEIATNVLHNVGNVLNSVNVSAGIVVESVKQSRVSSLARVVALLAEHEADLGEFITSDPRGKHVPAHLAQLSDHLITDQKAIVGELESLRQNVEHIKEIVAMQQSYARVGGVKEMTDVIHLVEDSLRMNEGGLSRHKVEVVREFETVAPMSVEKHKILQILVNLLRNAKHACQDHDRADRRLIVRVAQGEGRVSISVTDNGTGIAPENLTRIFNHGFTTRKDGHGFGLHSGALAAKEMGGSLTAYSAGPGQGATFTLELPGPPSPETHHE